MGPAGMSRIQAIKAGEILDSRGNPTIKTKVYLDNGICGVASIASGASTGIHEAWELRDGDKTRYGGKGVLMAVKNVETVISPVIIGIEVRDQEKIDQTMIELDGTENKQKLGANAVLSVSLATARAAAAMENKELYQYLRIKFFPKETDWIMPTAMMNVLNGGKHAPGSVDLQEFMIQPKAETFAESLRWGVEIYAVLKKMLLKQGLPVGVGDEGGFMPKFTSHEGVLRTLVAAIEAAGYKPGKQVKIALDPAASEVYDQGKYNLKIEGKSLTSEELINLYSDWVEKYPINSIEDGLAEDDWEGFKLMTQKLGNKIQIVGDDLYVTNIKRLQRGIKEKATNAILIKLNQIGTLTETVAAMQMAKENNMAAIVSHRSGETEDSFIADLVVAANTGQIKAGAPCRFERVAKYNRLLEIERELGKNPDVS
jgi:enolase